MTRTFRRSALAAALVGLGCTLVPAVPATAAPAPPVPAYSLTVLPPTGTGNSSSALGVNDHGVVVGTARTTTASRPQFSIRWDEDGATDLGGLPDATFSRAFDVNNSGLAVGEAFTPSPEASRAVAFTPDGITPVGSLNDSGSGVANDVNDRGQITGVSFNGSFSRAFLGRVGTIKELPTPAIAEAVTTTRGNAVSRSGDVAGISFVVHEHGDHTHTIGQATLWSGFEAQLLDGTEDELSSQAFGLNDSGLVVGEENDGTDAHATVWEDGEIARLPGLDGLRHSRAHAVNEAGDIVGHATGFVGNSSFDGKAMLWRDGLAIDLNTQVDLPEGTILRNAQDINDAGTIVGSAATPDGTRGFVLTPRAIADSHLHVDDQRTSYGTAATFDVEVHSSGPTDGTVTLSVDGRERATAEVGPDGTATLTAPEGLRPGSYDAHVRYSGTAGTSASDATVALVVTRARPVLSITTKAKKRAVRVVIGAGVPDSAVSLPGYVKIRLKGEGTRLARLQDGRARAAWRDLAPGRYVVRATYLPDELAFRATARAQVRLAR